MFLVDVNFIFLYSTNICMHYCCEYQKDKWHKEILNRKFCMEIRFIKQFNYPKIKSQNKL